MKGMIEICPDCGKTSAFGAINHCEKSHKELERWKREEGFSKDFYIGPVVNPLGIKAIYDRI